MSVNAPCVSSLRKAVVSNRNLIMAALAGVCMIFLVRFVLGGMIVGMFGVWGISLVGVAAGGYLLLRFQGAYN